MQSNCMDKANIDLTRLADEFIRESRSIKTKSELLSKLAEYERRVCQFAKAPLPQPHQQTQQLFYESKIPTAHMMFNPFAPTQDPRKQSKSNIFKNTDPGFGMTANRSANDFFRQDIDRIGVAESASRIPRPPVPALPEGMLQMVRPKDQYPFQHNEFLKDHFEQEPQYVRFYKKQVQVSPFHSRRV